MQRRNTRQVNAGGVLIGGGAPISVQSMTNTDTRDAENTIRQIGALMEAGADIVRISVYDRACLDALKTIVAKVSVPLVADIHFDSALAVGAMERGIKKVRINPGNIGGAEKIKSLASAAKAHGVPIRVGVNSGSVEKELLEKFGGPTVEALAQSALKHVRLLEDAGFYGIVISAKASNAPDTISVNRLLSEKTDYPLHIGVTEAGYDTGAIIKSSVGIGALLADGIGDTIRVSMTGDPVNEVITARGILRASGVIKQGVEVVSCPTCGRCCVDLYQIVKKVEAMLPKTDKYIKIAIMGCAVNGPGEAREADLGIAFGDGKGMLIKKGTQFFLGDAGEAVDKLIETARQMISQ